MPLCCDLVPMYAELVVFAMTLQPSQERLQAQLNGAGALPHAGGENGTL